MRRVMVVVAVLAVVAGLAWWLWPSDVEPSAEPSGTTAVSANEGGLPAEVKPSAWNAPVQARGERTLSGVVLRDGNAVPGAVVTAVAAHGEDVLSDLPCKCDNHCGQMLLACGCAEASGQLVELVGQRTGESAPLARATTDAEGKFTLTGLEATTLTLFADAPNGMGWLANVAPDAQDAKVNVSEGRTIKGKVLTTDGKPAKGALVTAIFAEHSRFFDVVADSEGQFKLGPLPLGKYAVVAMQGGLLPDHHQVGADEEDEVTLELSVPRSLSGVVLADGTPVPGATVKLEGMHRKRTVTSGAKGEFSIERLRPGEYELTAEASTGVGLVSATISKREDKTGLTINLKQGEPLIGRVVTESSVPIEGAKVSVSLGKNWRNVETDAQGSFRFVGTGSEEVEVWASKKGFLQTHVKARAGQSGLELRLPQAAVLSGLVRTSTGELVTTYTVRATPADAGTRDEYDFDDKSERAKVTDGGFELEVWPGEYELSVETERFTPAKLKAIAPSTGLVLVVKPGATIRGKVFDEDGLPAKSVSVRARMKSDRYGGRSAKTESDGRFEITGLEAGQWLVTAIAFVDREPAWNTSGEVTLSEQGSAELVLRPRAGVPFAGVVISSEGEPVQGAEVTAWQDSLDGGFEVPVVARATTDEQGRFRLRSMVAGEVQLSTEHRKRHLETHQVAKAPDEHVVVKLNAGLTISGRVVNSEGQPITEFSILHQPVEAADGRFSIPMREGTSTLAFDAEGYAQLIRPVKLKQGDNPLGDVVMQRGRPVTGVVRDARTKQPIEGALIDVGVEQAENFLLSERNGAVPTDSQGRYRLPAVDSSSTYIFVTARQYVSASQPLQGNTADFELKPSSTLTVKLVDALGAPFTQRAWVAATGKGMVPLRPASTPGTYESKEMSPGSWTISVQADPSRTFRSTQVTIGETNADLTIREATDGVTVELKPTEANDGMVLVPGTVASVNGLKGVMMRGDSLRVINGSAHNVLPGAWTVLLFRRNGMAFETAMQPIEVKAANNPVWTISPQWQAVDPSQFR